MPPIKLTLESFEDVAGYPGKIFYVLHEYPGTGCPQVPYLAIDKTDDGGFKIRDLNPTPRKEFKDAQYKYDRPRDPRLQWACAKASSMPVIQEVKSIDLDFFQKNKHTQGLMVSKDGCSIEQNGAHTSPVVKPESSSRVLMGISVQDSSVTNSDDASTSRSLPVIIAGGSGVKTEEFMSTNIGNEVRQIEQKVRTWDSSPQDTASLGAVSGSGTSESGGTMVDVSKQIKSLDQQRSSTPRNILAVGGEGCVASQKARSAELMDSVSKHTDTVGQNSVDKSSVLLKESSVQDNAVNLKGSPSVTQKTGSAELKAKLDKVETLATTLPHSSTGSSLLKESSVQGKAIPNSTVIQNASTSRTELIGKKLDNVLEEDPKVCGSHNSSPAFGAASKKIKVERSRARSVDAEVDDAPSNILASLPVPVDNSKGHKEVGIAESEYPGKSCIDDSPIVSVAKTVHESHSSSGKSTLALNKPCVKQKRKSNAVTCSDTPVESTINEASFDSVASVAETDEEEVTPRYAVIKEISGIISDILTEHVKSSNHTSTAPTVTDLGMSKIDTKSEPQKIPKRDCPSTVRFDEKGTPDNTSHVDVVNELSSMVTGIISSCSKSSNSANSDLKKFRELKDQTDMDKSNLKKSREAPFLPKVQRELSEVDRIINKARNFVKQKRIEFLEFEDQPAMKPSRGSSVGGRSKEVEAKDKYQKQKSETILKKSVTSASKAGCSGDIISKEPDSAQGSGKRSSSSFKPNSAGSSSCVELKDSACDSSSVGFAGTPVDVYELPEGDGEPACKPASKVSQRRNTVDGSENGRGVQIKRCSSKYLPYNLQKYRKELDKHRPTKKHPNIVKAQKSVESPSNDEKSAAQSRSCPGSPVSSPVQVASNAPQESKPIKKPTSDNVMESSKNSVTNSEGSLSSYAEPCVSKTPKRSESKMKERQTKMLQLLQKKKLTPETHAVVDKSDSGTITKPRSPEVGGSSQKLQNVGMHKLPAMVSCRTQVKPLPKKAVKKDNSNSRLKVGSLTKGGDKNKNLEKEIQAKDAGKISKIDPQVKSVSENLRNVVTDKMDLSPLTEIRKLQFALKRQKKLESSPSSSPLRKSEQIKVTEVALPGDENAVTSSPKTTSVNDKSSTILSLGDVPSDCTLYSDLTPAAKLLKNDVKKCLDPPKTLDPNLTPKRLTDRKNEKTDIKNKTEYDKVPKKGSVSPLRNEEESLIKNSSIVDLSRQGSPIVKIAPVESSVVTASREKPASSTSADTSPTIANDLDKGRQHSPKAEASPVVAKEASLLELRPSAVTPPTAFSSDGCATAESRETVVSSHVLANISSTRVMSPHESRTTESRKQILHQLTSKLPEINALSPFDGSAYKADAHEERLGLEDIGSHDFIEDRIKNVVNDIVKVNIGNEKMKNCGTLDPPTAEELGELYSEIFDDDISQTERDETATKLLADESNVAANLSAAPVSVVANAKVGQKVDDLPEGINEGIEQETESYQTATDTPVEQSDVNTVTPTVVPEKNASDLQEIPVNQSTTTDQMASSEMNVNCEESPAPSSCESTAAASVLTENNGTGENQKETQLSQISSGSRCFPGSPSNDDVVEISSQDSSPEIVDVDAVGPSSQTTHHLNSVAMPKPIVTLSSEPMDEDVVITGVTTITGKSLLTVASSSISESSRSSSKRSPTGESSPQKRKRMCFIPAPMLLPVNTSIPSNIKSRLVPTVEPVMPLPMLEFRDSPTRRSGSPASHAPPKLTVQDNVPETPGTSSAEPLSSPAPPILTDEQAPPTLEPILPEPSSECQESPSPTTASLTPPTLSEQEKDSDTSEATSTEPSSSAQKRMSTLSGKLHGTSSSPARNDHGMKTDPGPSAKSIATRKVLHKEKSRAGHFLPGGWRWQAKLNQVSQRRGGWHRYPPKSDQSSEGTERNPSTECKTSQEDVRIHCTAQDKLEVERNSRRDCCEAESRSTPPELSPVHRDHMKERSCSQPPDLSPIRSVGTEGSPTPTEPPESTPGQRETQRRPCKRIILTTPLTREGSGQESTAPNQDSTTVTCGRHQRDPPRIIKAGREEAAWRNQTEGGRRFLGRRLRNFFQPVATPGSSKSFSGKWTDRGGSSRASGPSQQAAVAASPSTKKLRSSAGHSGGKSDVRHRDGGVQKGRPWKADGPHQDGAQKGRSWKSDSPRQDGGAQEPWKTDDRRQDGGARKDRSSPQKRRAGPGQGKGDKRKTEGGRSHPVLRSTAHKTRSGLIRKGDS